MSKFITLDGFFRHVAPVNSKNIYLLAMETQRNQQGSINQLILLQSSTKLP
jgi:hypothetical protein